MGGRLEIRVLGPIEVHEGYALAIGGPRQRRIVAALAMRAGEVVSVDRLAEIAWADGDPPEQAARNVRSYVNRIREGLGGVAGRLVTVPPGYVLELRAGELDADDLVAQARAVDEAIERGDLDAALTHTTQALERWRGRPYAEFADEEWAIAEVQRLEEVRLHVLERRCEILIELGRPDDSLAQLEVLIAEQPYRERSRRLQMLALYHAGRGPEALRAFQDFRSLLVEEIGVDPSTDLVELDRQIIDRAPTIRRPVARVRRARGYQLHEVIGEGAFAVVWRATQPSLEREVAVKQVREQLADDPDFIRRFEVEARIVSSLEHPYVVPLYDYWREPGAAYLVFRMMPSGSLETRLHAGRLSDRELRRFVEQIGSALRTAHQHGVIHRDVKPGNVLIDAEGNFFLTDFGIAFGADSADNDAAAALSTGSPSYASPEQLRRETIDARADIYGFGITLFEAATGEAPFGSERTRTGLVQRQLEGPPPAPSSVDPSVPAWVDEVVARATAMRPGDRYPTMDDLLDDVMALAAGEETAPVPGTPSFVVSGLRNPFKGLDAFNEADAGDFRGRRRLVVRLLSALQRPGSQGRFVAAVGPSGSGKSSVVRAGLVPELRRGAIEGSADWFVTTMMPGAHPFEELEQALVRVAAAPTGPLAEMMAGSDRGIVRAVNQVIPDESGELLLVIDQFEELFTLVDEDERRRFLDGLLVAVKEPRARLRVVVTIRADFWDRPLRHPGLAALLETSAITVTPLSPDELERVIVEPVAEQGMAYEPGLVSRITAEVVDQPGALPLLQYTLMQLFDRHVSGLLTSNAYDDLGGVGGSVAMRAEETFSTLTTEQQVAARGVFGRLVSLGEGIEDTRRRVTVAELGDDPAVGQVIEAFGRARLLSFDRDPVTRGPTVEVAHEAVIRSWPRLRGWVDDDRDGLRTHRHLTTSAVAWNERGRDDGDLYRGARLDAAEAWAAAPGAGTNTLEREFLAAGIARRDAEREVERVRLRRLHRLVVTTAVVAAVALVAGGLAWRSQRRADAEATRAETNAVLAEREATDALAAKDDADSARSSAEVALADADAARQEAESARIDAEDARDAAEQAQFDTDLQRLRSAAVAQAADQPSVAALLAVEAARLGPGRDSDAALHRVLTAVPGYRGHLDSFSFPANLTADGTTLVASGRTIDVWDLTTMTLVNQVEHDRAGADEGTAVSPDGRWYAVTGRLGTRLFDLESGERGPSVDTVGVVAEFSHDSTLLAVDVGEAIELLDVATLESVGELAVGPFSSMAWSPTEDVLVVVGFGGTVTVWDVATGEPRWSITDEAVSPLASALAFSPDGGRVLIAVNADPDYRIVALDAADGSMVFEPTPTPILLWSIAAMDVAGDRVLGAGAGVASSPYVFDLATGEGSEAPLGGVGGIGVSFSTSLGLAISWGNGGVDLWAVDGSTPLERRIEMPAWAASERSDLDGVSVAIDPGSGVLHAASGTARSSARIDLSSDPPTVEEGTLRHVVGAGRFVLEVDDGVVLRDERGEAVGTPVATPPDLYGVAVSPDGRFFGLARFGGLVDLHRGDGSLVATLEVPEATPGRITDASFSDDGSLVAAWTQGGTNARAVWRTDDLSIVQSEADVTRLRYFLAGDVLYTNRRDLKVIDRLDPSTLEPVGTPLIGHSTALLDVEYDAELGLIATLSVDGTVRLWDEATGRQFGREIPAHGSGLQFTDGGASLLTRFGRYASIWNLDTATWPELACRLAGRNLTREEWADFGPSTVEYRATCPQYPIEE